MHVLPAVLFTVEAERTNYASEYGGNVVMGCRFSPKPSHPQKDLKVTWLWTSASPYQEVIRKVNASEHSTSQKYEGRVRLLTDELQHGWAKIQVWFAGSVISALKRTLLHETCEEQPVSHYHFP